MDHVGRLTHFVSRKLPPRFYVPKSVVELTENYLRSGQELTNNAAFATAEEYTKNHELIGVANGDAFEIAANGTKIAVAVWSCDHSVPTVGYGFSEIKSKLRKEFVGMKGAEIAKRRAAGDDVNELVKRKMFAFLGDTTHKVFDDHPDIVTYPVVIVECSFIDEAHYDAAVQVS
jgi:ribonuclease Z